MRTQFGNKGILMSLVVSRVFLYVTTLKLVLPLARSLATRKEGFSAEKQYEHRENSKMSCKNEALI